MARKEDSRVTVRANSQLKTIEEKFPRSSKGILWYLTLRFLFAGTGIRRTDDPSKSNLAAWDNTLRRYVNDPSNGIPQTAEGKTSARGNLTNQVFSEDEGMSMSTFVKTAAVCDIAELEIIAIWKTKGGKRIVGKVSYPLTADVMKMMNEVDEESVLISEFNELLQGATPATPEVMDSMYKRIQLFRQKKAENNNE